MRTNLLLAIIIMSGLAFLSGCGKDSDAEAALEKEFQEMQPKESELGDFDAKVSFPDRQKKTDSAPSADKR